MADGLEDLDRLLVDVLKAGAEALPAARGVIQKGALNVKAGWRENARVSAGAHGRHYPNSITYSTRIGAGWVEAEIGPESGRTQGGMGRGFEYGSRNQPPHLDGNRAADVEEPRLAEYLAALAGELL
jgi:hypothetical protein